MRCPGTVFDARYRPAHLTSGPLDLTCGYDGVGNVTSVVDARSEKSARYEYWLYDNKKPWTESTPEFQSRIKEVYAQIGWAGK
jgi:hypothetical protein